MMVEFSDFHWKHIQPSCYGWTRTVQWSKGGFVAHGFQQPELYVNRTEGGWLAGLLVDGYVGWVKMFKTAKAAKQYWEETTVKRGHNEADRINS